MSNLLVEITGPNGIFAYDNITDIFFKDGEYLLTDDDDNEISLSTHEYRITHIMPYWGDDC